jgi:hypothetical protein
MQTRIALFAISIAVPVVVAAFATSCKTVDCGAGTTERDGLCVPASETVSAAMCGPHTTLHGTQCEPDLPPAVCDPATTEEDIDAATGVITCIGTGGGGCAAKLACATPTDGKQTICGQLYDFETNQPFAAAGATGAACTPSATGPCSLGIRAYDAVAFAMNPQGTTPLTTDAVYIDDCGRYRVPEIAQPGGPFIALALDDATAGPGGTTNAVGIATPKSANTATKDFEAFIVRGATTTSWGAQPSLAAGIYAAVYRPSRTASDPATGVTLTIAPATNPAGATIDANRDFYFQTGSANRSTLDAAANATTTNGTALLSGATLTELYGGTGALPATCIWEPHAAAAIPGAIFIQIFRPTNAPGMTCSL